MRITLQAEPVAGAVSAFASCGRAVAHVRGGYGPLGDKAIPETTVAFTQTHVPMRKRQRQLVRRQAMSETLILLC
jgi:hypothetical protein